MRWAEIGTLHENACETAGIHFPGDSERLGDHPMDAGFQDAAGVGRGQDQGGIGAAFCASDGDDGNVCWNQSRIEGGCRDLHGDFGALTEEAKGMGDDLGGINAPGFYP